MKENTLSPFLSLFFFFLLFLRGGHFISLSYFLLFYYFLIMYPQVHARSDYLIDISLYHRDHVYVGSNSRCR